jgi:hypothetical protein
MARRLLPTIALLLLAMPAVQAAPPTIGYAFTPNPSDGTAGVPAGGTHTYNLTIQVEPATGDTAVILVVGFSDFRAVYPTSIAPLTQVSIRAVDADDYTSLGVLSGFTENKTYPDPLPRGEYKVQVTSTLDADLGLGNHTSYLGFTARDPNARTSTATASYPFRFQVVPPPNRPPVAAFVFGVVGTTVSFDASPSSDPDGDPLGYLWTFGDGATDSGRTPSHSFAPDHTYNVRLRVSDPGGATNEHTASVVVGAAGGTGGGNTGGTGGGGNTGGTSGTTATADTDGDGILDADEIAAGSNPNDRSSVPTDRDGDGKPNESDNCPAASNPDQADKDADQLGDACDPNGSDGPGGDPDGDGKPSSADDCPGAANADQLDADHDGKGDACDTDLDGDGVLNEADAFPTDAAETADHDRDGIGDHADPDDDNDLVPDAEEAASGSDPLDRHDPPWLATMATAVRRPDGSNLVTWHAPSDPRLQRFLLWREASPYVLVDTIAALGGERYEFTDPSPPPHARYHVQAQLDGVAALSYLADDDRATNWVTAAGAVDEGCPVGSRDTDRDGLCDSLERQMGLDPADADSDGDGLKDGDELLGHGGASSLPSEADSDGDGRSDAQERAQGTDPMHPDAATVEPKEGKGLPGWLWPTIIIAGAIVLAALILSRRRPPSA